MWEVRQREIWSDLSLYRNRKTSSYTAEASSSSMFIRSSRVFEHTNLSRLKLMVATGEKRRQGKSGRRVQDWINERIHWDWKEKNISAKFWPLRSLHDVKKKENRGSVILLTESGHSEDVRLLRFSVNLCQDGRWTCSWLPSSTRRINKKKKTPGYWIDRRIVFFEHAVWNNLSGISSPLFTANHLLHYSHHIIPNDGHT
jgi:hypothetical protein